MVTGANRAHGELGGHIALHASCAEIFEVGFNHFFQARTDDFGGGSCLFSAALGPWCVCPGFLGRPVTEEDLKNYRQEVPTRD